MEEPFKFVPLELTESAVINEHIEYYNRRFPAVESKLVNLASNVEEGTLEGEYSRWFLSTIAQANYNALIKCSSILTEYTEKEKQAKATMYSEPVFVMEKKDSPAEKFKKRNNECDIQLHLGYEKDGKEYVGVVIGRYDNLPKTDYIHVMFPENGEMNYIAFQPVSKEDAGKYKNCHKVAFYDGFGIEKSHFTLRSREVVDAIKEFAGGKEWSTYNLKRTSLGIYYIEKEKDNEQ